MKLNKFDIHFCVKRLPRQLKKLMEKEEQQIIVAGGFIRSVIAGEPISDIDLFAGDKAESEKLALELVDRNRNKLYFTNNAITLKVKRRIVQFIHRWVYENPLDVVRSFDFTICMAAIWFNKDQKRWDSHCHTNFYQDLSAKRLIYTSPARNEDAGGSMLRVLKYYQRGYRIPLDSFAAVIARLVSAVELEKIINCENSEAQLTKVLAGLLFEVDPNARIDREVYLPREDELEDSNE